MNGFLFMVMSAGFLELCMVGTSSGFACLADIKNLQGCIGPISSEVSSLKSECKVECTLLSDAINCVENANVSTRCKENYPKDVDLLIGASSPNCNWKILTDKCPELSRVQTTSIETTEVRVETTSITSSGVHIVTGSLPILAVGLILYPMINFLRS